MPYFLNMLLSVFLGFPMFSPVFSCFPNNTLKSKVYSGHIM